MKKKIAITILICFVVLLPWLLLRSDQAVKLVTVLEVHKNSILVEDRENQQVTVYGSESDIQPIQKNKNYYIVYESRWFWLRKPQLISIKLMPDDI
ncbi:hypothetical protein LQV63_16020 [Paenibacillus profundus]|uniref:DUF3221 domain-containing protein n=1 Tax=Paenibacillus profundus TaxID=1173085 RepID=A0ABS8YKM3_9BACL|nr:hypothetical protein [Paenibacillus profundus]MCE5170812.1 hypothetical protein [Paenibacillus profundus]